MALFVAACSRHGMLRCRRKRKFQVLPVYLDEEAEEAKAGAFAYIAWSISMQAHRVVMQSTSILRLFISLNPPPEIISRLRDQQTFLRERLDERYGPELSVRWTKPAQFHLTLLFLGNLFWQQLEWIREQIAETVAAANALPTLQLSGFGCFPVFKSPRILWIGVEPQAQLHTLQTDLLARLSLHLALDSRDTSYPHITLGRIVAGHRLGGFSELLRHSAGAGAPPSVPWKTTSVSLMQSIPGPHGVEYTCLVEFVAKS
jgi:2'-5' RNA ligase